MAINKNKRGEGTLHAAQQIRELIISGELPSGQKISERDLGDRLQGLSRTPLREALKVLEAEGLVIIRPNRGAVVTSLTIAEVEDAINLLIGLESMAAEAACEKITAEAIHEIETLQNQMELAHCKLELMNYFNINQKIHECIVNAAKNSVLSRIYSNECLRIRRYRYAGNLSPERWARAVAEHRNILDALKNRAGPLLRETLRAHHKNGWVVSRNLLERETSQSLTRPPKKPKRKTLRDKN